MYHCNACGWDGETPADREELLAIGSWMLRVCPECGEEVYETMILREPPSPYARGHYTKNT